MIKASIHHGRRPAHRRRCTSSRTTSSPTRSGSSRRPGQRAGRRRRSRADQRPTDAAGARRPAHAAGWYAGSPTAPSRAKSLLAPLAPCSRPSRPSSAPTSSATAWPGPSARPSSWSCRGRASGRTPSTIGTRGRWSSSASTTMARASTRRCRATSSPTTGHAVLDALAALYDALTPETLGLHEAIGNLTAMVIALQSRQIRNWLVAQATLAGDTVVSQLAQQFGAAMYGRPLRDLNNQATMTSVGSARSRTSWPACSAARSGRPWSTITSSPSPARR